MSSFKNIRNFSIIAHIDHGKSTLADRLLEATGTIEKRKMKEQVLDQMDLERERGITIKMQPVRMVYHPHRGSDASFGVKSATVSGRINEVEPCVLNLIDTPGHIDFSYEVSRAMQAVEGAILLVDSTQGVQAQTLSVLRMAREAKLTIIPVMNKIDLPLAQIKESRDQIVQLLGCSPDDVLATSGKTGEGIPELLERIVVEVPAPTVSLTLNLQALVFDFAYDTHRGMIVFVRIVEGKLEEGAELLFLGAKDSFNALEVGIFAPEKRRTRILQAGEIGYVVTGLKRAGAARVGDTITTKNKQASPLPGYSEPTPMVWASLYPEEQDDFGDLRQSLERLKLSDAALSYEEEASGAIGRGFRCGFLGMLHLEIVSARLEREFKMRLIVTAPTICYEIELVDGRREKIYAATLFPEESRIARVYESWVRATIITPPEFMGAILHLLYEHEAVVGATSLFGDNRTSLTVEMPLRELMRNFFDELKSVSSGYASLSYEITDMRQADVALMEVLVADEVVGAFAKIVARRRIREEAEATVERLREVLPRQMFDFKIQARAQGRIIASRSMSGMKKDVTDYLYGGDITRKMKLREKQKKGKKRMKARGRVEIPHEVFLKMMKPKD
ncbi:MAG: elongation factor 4 [Candidatus Vogelbacteria bacterium CG10_big_fil_rev_8_21_14_0_10_51_16]|uniref:Elongation factor 4 n=1 Tax=Candidatus Vogelbacteria bacterium CG10_big_fil_rev_8_21_14_0_10_51_16 TaxID=1975045 RepID=A0A2H0REX6_9BACT|nr:MAG: elongation factor 4 [Candidatus Vogelbacteria bacterium CG10_big_fil_rev_8_21_14_0_10_51_16]